MAICWLAGTAVYICTNYRCMSAYFKNKTVVVTGGSDGIGKALVENLLQQGAKVATCARSNDKLYDLQLQNANRPLFTAVADVSNEGDCKNFIESAAHHFGGVDILINNAGISMRALFADAELDTLRKLMDVNFWGTVYCSKFALPYIKQSKGDIAAISSIAGYRGLPGRCGYSASKFAVNGFMEALRTELRTDGVNVLWISPGFTASNIRKVALDKEGKPQGETPLDESKLMSSEECARHILHAIEKRRRSLILTTNGKQTVYMNKFLPGLADKLVHRFFFKNGQLIK